MLEAILAWIAKTVLSILLNRAVDESKKAAEAAARDKEREEVNDANAKAYEDAKSREEARRAAIDLLNRSRRT